MLDFDANGRGVGLREPLCMQWDEGWLECLVFLSVQPNPLMDEVRVEAVAQRDIGDRGAGFGALLYDLGFEGFAVGTALWLHEESA